MSEASTSEVDSDEAEQQRLKEAVVDGIQISRQSTDKINPSTDSRNVGKPSLRPRQTEQEDSRDLSTTPEFRAHVALKLTMLLDDTWNLRGIRSVDGSTTSAQDEGIRLFQQSSRAIKEFVDNSYTVTPQRRRRISSSENSSEDDRLAEAAVSHEFIIRESERIIGGIQKDSEKRSEVSDSSFQKETIDKNNEVHKKCKKKKKHKHYKVDGGGGPVL